MSLSFKEPVEYMAERASRHGDVLTVSLSVCREAASLSGLSVREAEIAALRGGLCPARYERTIGTFGLEGQARLLESCAAVAGCGGLGGWITEILARAGVGRLILIDGDVFDENNLNRQLYATEENIGEPKAAAAAERELQILFSILAIAALFVVFLFGFFMKHQITNRMKRLQHEIEAIRDEASDARSITIDRKRDEIASIQRTLNDFMAFFDFKQGEKNKADDITISVYKRFAEAGRRLCMKTLEDIATAFSPGDEKFRAALVRGAAKARDFARENGFEEEDLIYIYLGALFSRMGMLSLPFSIRTKTSPLTPAELREYRKYPIKSKDFMEAIELLRPASALPYAWNENWDGTGFPQGLSGSAIPIQARIFAIADAWNEMTRPWPGRRIPSEDEVIERLRAQAGTRLDPQLVEKFIAFLKQQKY